MEQQETMAIKIYFKMKNFIILLFGIISITSCNKKSINDNYSVEIHYQTIIFKFNEKDKKYHIYTENILKFRNKSKNTLKISPEDIKLNFYLVHKNNKNSFYFMSKKEIVIPPQDSLDVVTAVNTKITVDRVPDSINRSDFRIYNVLKKNYINYSVDYDIIRSTSFGLFKEEFLNKLH
ncbi:hypothetical protein HZP39_08640 [Elizabethkingia anophelis]|uniref:hypothetical protein n=1 Tax=Elizabethkingia TaxID=308865 RepID=UPI0004E3D39B|nr:MULTISPECIES: hypothetical protein [Elizabethkingia]KFC39399.1 hypothetical protein FF18_13965 [Elizabethkingia anophelis]MCT3670251.1 hypothetical protein [Elizabethkingia anophelis]MCT3688129.1 hypothetical protein [Elizabethkingia anophelis]MCT3707058.1 hypothetical protein [Elizabethkingia anophelis]MCT3713743.1 hypothetical protein [Elizabethkingia anophelis]